MQRRHVIGLIIAFVAINSVILVWVWNRSSRSPLDDRKEVRERTKKDFETTDAMAYNVITTWNRNPTLAITSNALTTQIHSLPENGCVRLPSGAVPVTIASLPAAVKSDLDAAIIGLLRAYTSGDPDPVLAYMRNREEKLNPQHRQLMERALSKRGLPNAAELGDEDLYRRMWTTSGNNAHWSGLVVESSCRQAWDGKNIPLVRLAKFDKNSTPEESPDSLEQAAYLFRLFRGDNTAHHNFISTNGSLKEAVEQEKRVLLCDIQLIVEFDKSRFQVKAPYLVRFWFNGGVQKWQPICMSGFASDPKKVALPSLLF